MVTLTTSAINKVQELLREENDPTLRLRMFVQGGGCSGFQYGFAIDSQKNDDDFEIQAGMASVLIDATSAQYLQGAEVDYIDDLTGARFSIHNPQAQVTCGCGSSFSF